MGGGFGTGRPVLHFIDDDAPCGSTPCTLVLADARTGPQTALLQAYTSLHPHVLALVVLVRAFARGQKLVDVGTPPPGQGQGQGPSNNSTGASSSASSTSGGSGGSGSGLLSSYTWSILALHFLLHERYVPNLHCLSDHDNLDLTTENNHITTNASLLQSLSPMTSEQAVIALQQPVHGLSNGTSTGSGQGRGRGRDPVTYLTRLEETTPLALLRDMFQVSIIVVVVVVVVVVGAWYICLVVCFLGYQFDCFSFAYIRSNC